MFKNVSSAHTIDVGIAGSFFKFRINTQRSNHRRRRRFLQSLKSLSSFQMFPGNFDYSVHSWVQKTLLNRVGKGTPQEKIHTV